MRVVASFVILVGILAACGGASETGLFDEVPTGTSNTSGQASSSGASGAASSTSGASTSGVVSSSGASSGCTSEPCSSSSTSGVIVPPPKDAGPPGPRKCNTADLNGCFPNEYCQAQACGATGVCTVRAAEAQDYNPICGCDHITYWNPAIASSRGANVAAAGACATGLACARNPGCAGDAVCNLEQAACTIAEVKGTCWMLPKTCDGTNTRKVRRCSNAQCTSLCLAIVDERQFVLGTGCP